MKLGIVLSDLHIGSGHKKGHVNIYDDFREDARFAQLLHRYSSGKYLNDEVHLILNGDIFDLLKVPVNGKFPDLITERLGITKVEQCLHGHPQFIHALKNFLKSKKNKLTFQPGNHDMEFFFPGVQRLFCRTITGQDIHPQIHFVPEEPFLVLEDGVQIHHGHQFEALHAFDFKKLFITSGQREPMLNLPWGSLFVLHVLNKLISERPYIDKVMPFWPMIAGGMVVDTRFTVKILYECAFAFGRARLNPVWWQKRPFEKVSRFIRQDIGFFGMLERNAKRILKQPETNIVVMGHTHGEMVRTFPGDKVYVNTGTWMPMINLNLSGLGQKLLLHYALIEWNDDAAPRVALMRWNGQLPEEEEIIS